METSNIIILKSARPSEANQYWGGGGAKMCETLLLYIFCLCKYKLLEPPLLPSYLFIYCSVRMYAPLCLILPTLYCFSHFLYTIVCKSCILKHLETSYNCPVCQTEIHKTRPLLHVRYRKMITRKFFTTFCYIFERSRYS